ncbi:Cys-tRNA deacylase [Pseudomonas viridiflava]|uniref:Cys-tRNA deacylase n=3 Tax=Pseudomonas syringae group TaxID=136849 RepID=A0A3M4PGA4_PSEVI|nr:Cys-tRNA deacylase [Pseudomonas viridiflava]
MSKVGTERSWSGYEPAQPLYTGILWLLPKSHQCCRWRESRHVHFTWLKVAGSRKPKERCMTPALDLLKKLRAEHRIHSYEHDPKAASYGLEAAEKLGLEPARVFKTLLASTEKGELLVAVVPVVGTLDLKALAQAAGAKKTEMADPAAAQRSTGYLLGGISPLGQKKRLRTFIDDTAQGFESIHVSAGRRGLEVELSAAVLAEHTQARFAAIGRE